MDTISLEHPVTNVNPRVPNAPALHLAQNASEAGTERRVRVNVEASVLFVQVSPNAQNAFPGDMDRFVNCTVHSDALTYCVTKIQDTAHWDVEMDFTHMEKIVLSVLKIARDVLTILNALHA